MTRSSGYCPGCPGTMTRCAGYCPGCPGTMTRCAGYCPRSFPGPISAIFLIPHVLCVHPPPPHHLPHPRTACHSPCCALDRPVPARIPPHALSSAPSPTSALMSSPLTDTPSLASLPAVLPRPYPIYHRLSHRCPILHPAPFPPVRHPTQHGIRYPRPFSLCNT